MDADADIHIFTLRFLQLFDGLMIVKVDGMQPVQLFMVWAKNKKYERHN